MVFPGYARQSGPDPVNTQDLATKHYVDADWGVSAADLNTLTTGGTYIAADTNANPPPLPVGQYFLDVRHVGAVLQQRATHLTLTNYIATRMYSGSWSAWHSPAAGLLWQGNGPGTAYSGGAGTVWSITGLSVPIVAGRRYRVTLWFAMTNNSGASSAFTYFTLVDSLGIISNVIPNNRISWIGAALSAGQSWYGSGSHSCQVPASNGTLTYITVGLNPAGSPAAVGANAMELVFEDMGI